MSKQQAFMRRVSVMAGVVGCLCTAGALAVVTFDGTVHYGAGEEWANSRGNAVQTNYTGYGDQRLTPGGFGGSELDELYVKADANFLYLGVTGNLEQNLNAITVLIEARTGGQNVLKSEIAPVVSELPCSANGPPTAVQSMGQALLRNNNATPADDTDDFTERGAGTGTTLDVGFGPNYAFSVDTNGGTLHVTQYTLSDTTLGNWDDPSTGPAGCATAPNPASNESLQYYATRIYRGSNAVNGGAATLSGGNNPNGSQFAFNNTGKLGVTGVIPPPSTTPPPPPAGTTNVLGDPRSQTTGLEAKISLADLGFSIPNNADLTVKVMVVISASSGFFSNQTLPPVGAGANDADLNFRPNFVGIAGNQFATVTRTVAQFGAPGPIDGLNIPSNFTNNGADPGTLVASQDSVTSFGDRDCLNTTGGSELDEFYMHTDGNFLYVAVSGNLEGNANAQVLFLDVKSGGQNILKTEIAPTLTCDVNGQNCIVAACAGNGPPGTLQAMGQALLRNDNGTAGDDTDDVASRDVASTGTTLDAGFLPDYAIAMDTSGGNVHVSQYELGDPGVPFGTWDDPTTGPANCALGGPNLLSYEALSYFTRRVFRGNIGLGASGALTGGANPNASLYAYNNAGIAGVNGTADATLGDPRTQITGLEAKISLLDLGFAANQLPLTGPLAIKASVVLVAPNGKVSNQTLPGINSAAPVNPDSPNLGLRPNFTGVPNDQFVSANLAIENGFSAVIDGHHIVSEFNPSNGPALASQDTKTSFGNVHQVVAADCDQQLAKGSELDQIFVREQNTPETSAPGLAIAIAGNLETNNTASSRNNMIIFLDTKPGGEALLDGNAGRITQMTGNTLPMQADYAIVINNSDTTMFIDLIDLATNTPSFIGSDLVTGGDGILVNGVSNVADWRAIISNGNLDGVKGADAGVPRAPQPETANALTAATGFELLIPRSAIGSPADGSTICVFAAITNSNGGDLSNQFLPALANGGLPKYGGTKTNFATAGYVCLSATLGAVCNNPRYDSDGDTDVDLIDFAEFQKCFTGPGGSVGNPLYPPGCECYDWGGQAKNGNIDDEDFGAFQFCASRSKKAANTACDGAP